MSSVLQNILLSFQPVHS